MVLDLARAQELFDCLPGHLRPSTLSPAYVAADALRDPALQPLFLGWEAEAGFLLHAVHECNIAGTDYCDWQSAYGYGGPIVHALSQEALLEGWRALDEAARQRRVLAEFVRFHPLLDNQRVYPGTVRADRNVVRIQLTGQNLLESYSGRARTAIRKALAAGLQTRWEPAQSAREHFPAFYRAGMQRIGATDFYHFSDRYFEALLALTGARVLSVVAGDERLAMGLFLFERDLVEYHLSATTEEGRAAGATNLLLHAAASCAQENGCTQLFLGGGTDARADNPLLKFKSSFAPAELMFHFGYRVHDAQAYAQLQAAQPEKARSGRVLFYRG